MPSVLHQLDLFFIDRYSIRFGSEALFVMVCVGLIPVLNGCSGSASAEPLTEIAALGQ